MIRATRRTMDKFCVACFTGEYPFEQKAGGFVRRLEPRYACEEVEKR